MEVKIQKKGRDSRTLDICPPKNNNFSFRVLPGCFEVLEVRPLNPFPTFLLSLFYDTTPLKKGQLTSLTQPLAYFQYAIDHFIR